MNDDGGIIAGVLSVFVLCVCGVIVMVCNIIDPPAPKPTYSDYAVAYVEEINAKELDFDEVTPEDLGMSQTRMGGNSYWCPVNYPNNKLCRVTRRDDNTIRVYEDNTDGFNDIRFEYTRSEDNKVIARAVWY